jgi:hypothetical protein
MASSVGKASVPIAREPCAGVGQAWPLDGESQDRLSSFSPVLLFIITRVSSAILREREQEKKIYAYCMDYQTFPIRRS